MAQDHKLQDTPSTPPAKAAKRDRSSLPPQLVAATGPGGRATFALGVNAWALSVGWTLLSPDFSWVQLVLASTGLWPLALGVALRARTQRAVWSTGARWLLLCVFPLSLSAALCWGHEVSLERTHSAVSMSLAAISLLAYGMAALQYCRLPLSLLVTKSHARRSELPVRAEPQRLAKIAAAVLLCVGALAIALVAPLTTSFAALEATWGDAADAGAALTAVVAGAIGVTLVGVELGPLLRAQPLPRMSARTRYVRITTMLLLALLGATTYFVVR